MPSYTSIETKKACFEIENFYNRDCVNWSGKTKDTNEPYTEIIAAYLLENFLYELSIIKTIPRKKPYKFPHSKSKTTGSTRREELFCRELVDRKLSLSQIGSCKDYQIPLKENQDSKAGKIDLLSVDVNEKIVFILENKAPEADDTMLRCVLEIYTYYKQVNKEKLLNDFGYSGYNIIASPLVFYKSKAYNEMNDIKNRPYLKDLMDKLDINPFYIKANDGHIITNKELEDYYNRKIILDFDVYKF